MKLSGTTSTLLYLSLLVLGCLLCLGLARWGFPEAVSVGGVTCATILILLVLQRTQPYRLSWRNWSKQAGVDLLHGAFCTIGVTAIFQATVVGLVYMAADWMAQQIGWSLWPSDWPLWLQVPVALCVADFGAYWFHRMAHRLPILWRIHALHHSSEQLYVLSSARNHPFNVIGTFSVSVFPLVLLGCDGELLMLVSVFTAIQGLLQHANINFRLGAFNWILAGPELHRIHHSTHMSESNSNFGSNLILWDILFGTRTLPHHRHVGSVGLPDMSFHRNFFRHLVSPFQWKKLLVSDSSKGLSDMQALPEQH